MLAALALVVGSAPAAWAQSVVWTVIDVQSRLDNDGRLHVVETHHMNLREGGGFNLTREFGLAVDQSIVFHGITRIGPGETEQALEDAEVGLPDRYRYYPMGHVYLSIPQLERGTEVAYRMEYELVGALSPSWAIGAGKGPLGRPMSFDPPLARLREVVADLREVVADLREVVGDLREVWPPRNNVFRLDHDVLLPSRDGPGFVVERVDYHLSFDTTWKLVNPDAELGVAQIDKDYRVRQLFARVVEEVPVGVDVRAARIRWLAVAAVVAVAPALWLILMLCEWVGNRFAGRVTLESMNERLSTLAPEAVATYLTGRFGTDPTLEGVLARMAGERKIAIEIEPVALTPPRKPKSPAEPSEEEEEEDDDEDRPVVVKVRRLVPLESLPLLERGLLEKLLVGGRREVTSVELQSIYSKDGFEPWTVVKGLLPNNSKAPRSFLAGLLGLASLGGLVLQITSMANLDPVPIIFLANLLFLGAFRTWPRGYWHGARSWLAAVVLLVPGLFAIAAALALLVSANPPLPPRAFVGTAVVALAAYGALLAGARRPWRGEPHATVRELYRIRAYSDRELRRPQPRLDDRFVAHLEALGLGPRLEAWRAASGGMTGGDLSSMQADSSDGSAPPARPFTGRATVPFKGPDDWGDALWIPSREEREEMAAEG